VPGFQPALEGCLALGGSAACDETFDADVLIEVGPMDACAPANEPPVVPPSLALTADWVTDVAELAALEEVETGDPHRLFRKHQDRGVLDKPQVLECAKPFGKSGDLAVTALLFSQTEIFRDPVPIARARELCPEMNTDGYFVTTRRVDEQSARALYEAGSRSDD